MRSWLAALRLVFCPLLVAAFSQGAEAHQREEQGDVWVMTLDSQENASVATAIANTLGRIPKPGSVFDTIARVMLVTDAVGGGQGTETFGVGTVVIATLPRGSNLWGAIKAATEKIGRENQKDAREAAVQTLALQWLKHAGNSRNANVIANRLRFGNHVEQLVQQRQHCRSKCPHPNRDPGQAGRAKKKNHVPRSPRRPGDSSTISSTRLTVCPRAKRVRSGSPVDSSRASRIAGPPSARRVRL